MSAVTVPDGFYDNRATMRRENWRDGEVVESIAIALIQSKKPAGAVVPWPFRDVWGTYPDLPREVQL